MERCVILVCGMPASGKTTLARRLSERLGIPMFSKDEIKERLYDTVGFQGREGKVALGVGAMEAMYYAAGQVLSAGLPVILENNFENVSKPGVQALLEKYKCKPVTLQLTGDYEAIYRRFIQRDQSPERHRGHVVNTQYPEPDGPKPEYVPMGPEAFVSGFTARGMADFNIGGARLTVDATDLSRIDHEEVAEEVLRLISGK